MQLREGIIVRSQKYQENSKIITLVNEDSLTTFLVRGAASMKSHNFSYANEITKIAYDANTKRQNSFNILTNGKVIDNYSSIKTDFNKLNDCLLIIEATNQLGDHIEDFKTFYYFLAQILNLINTYQYNQYYLVIFRLKLLYLLGVGPIFSKCIDCESKDNLIGFDFESGGMKCKNCASNTVLYKGEVIEILKFLYLTKLEYLTNEVINKLPDYIDEALKFLDEYYNHYLGYSSRAEKVIKKMRTN
jgi:DNA repair protein RecO (recombination protein O)